MKVSTKRAKKVALKDMTPKQLRVVIRQLKREAKDKAWFEAQYNSASRAAAAHSRRAHELHVKFSGVVGRAEQARKYIDLGTPKPLNAAIAIAEWVAHGPLGNYPARNGGGMHPFKRWGLETPEEREARLEREEKEREEKYRAARMLGDFRSLLHWHE